MTLVNSPGRLLVFSGLILLGAGLLIELVGKIPGAGKFPGDILVKKGPVTFYFPLVTCLVISLFLSLLLSFFSKR